MVNWFDMDLPEGFCHDEDDLETSADRTPDRTQARYVGIMNAQGATICFLYSNNRVLRFDKHDEEHRFPTIDEAKNFIVTMCALNAWEAP